MTSFVVWLDTPPKALNPNGRFHHMAKAGAVRKYRRDACTLARLVMAGQLLNWHEVTAQVTFYHRDKRRRDPDNLAAMLKPAWDGLVDAGVLVDDDRITHKPIEQAVDRQGPGVKVEIWNTADVVKSHGPDTPGAAGQNAS